MIVGLRIFTYREVKVLDDTCLSVVTVDGDGSSRTSSDAESGPRSCARASAGCAPKVSTSPSRFRERIRHTYAGFLKLGWADVGPVPMLVKPLRLGGFLSRYVRNEWGSIVGQSLLEVSCRNPSKQAAAEGQRPLDRENRELR